MQTLSKFPKSATRCRCDRRNVAGAAGVVRKPLAFSEQKRLSVVAFSANESDNNVVTNPAPQTAEASTADKPQEQAQSWIDEKVFYEGSGSPAELAFSVAMLPTLIYAPLSIQAIGRQAWIKYKFTDKRIVITNNSPLFKSEVQVLIQNVKEVRVVSRAFGLWGDMVVFLKDGRQLDFLALPDVADLKARIEGSLPGARM